MLMKKFVTCAALALMGACAIPANAETAKIFINSYSYVGVYNDVAVDAEIVRLEDGSYSIPNFLGSDAPLSFKFTKPAVSMEKNYNVEVTSPMEYDTDYDCYYLMNSEGDYLECEYTSDDTTYFLFDPSIYFGESTETYIQWSESGAIKRGYDGQNYNFEYGLTLEADGYITTNPNTDFPDDEFNYIWFEIYFNGIEESNVLNAQEITVYIEDYNDNTVANPFVTNLIANNDGSFTITDVMNSGQPISFKFTEPEVNSWADFEITSPLDTSETYPYLMSENGKDYLYCIVYGYNDSEGPTEFNFPYVYLDGSGIYRYDLNDSDNTYEYYATICLNAFLEDDSLVGWFYLNFFFNRSSNGDDAAVNVISADENAPVEFFNLNGMRIENPSNGIFIRKQGNNVKKIVVR